MPEVTSLPGFSLFIKPPFHSSGMALVSVEYPCMDVGGACLGFELLRFSRFSGEAHYWERGCAAVMAAQQLIARKTGESRFSREPTTLPGGVYQPITQYLLCQNLIKPGEPPAVRRGKAGVAWTTLGCRPVACDPIRGKVCFFQ